MKIKREKNYWRNWKEAPTPYLRMLLEKHNLLWSERNQIRKELKRRGET